MSHRRAIPSKTPSSRQRGVAMLLLLVALVVGVILALSFNAAQSVSARVAQNIDAHAHARMIAETGMTMTLRQIVVDPAWRQSFADGHAVEQVYAGGRFTVRGEDGQPEADDMTFTAVGVFDGVSHRMQCVVTFGTGGGGAAGIAVNDAINLSNNAIVDSYDSSKGAYGGSNVSSDAVIATNSTGSGKITLANNAVLKGHAYAGAGGDPATVIAKANNAVITGSESVNNDLIEIPTPQAPYLGMSVGFRAYSGSDNTIRNSFLCYSLTLSNNAVVYIEGDVSLHVSGVFATGNNAQIILKPNATLNLYVSGIFSTGNNVELNNDSARPADFTIHNCGWYNLSLGNNNLIAATIISPRGTLTAGDQTNTLTTGNNTHIYGQFIGQRLSLDNNAQFHQDLHLMSGRSGVSGPGSDTTFLIRWLEGL